MTTTGILKYVGVKGAGQICLILDNYELSPEMVNGLPEDLRERLIAGDETIPVRIVYLRDKSLAEYKVEVVVIDDQERVISVKAESIDIIQTLS